MYKVFVYGTLQKGYGNHRLIEDQIFVGPAVTEEKFVLRNCGYPYCIREDSELSGLVRGEVWEVNDEALQRMDWLEGIPTHYQRTKVKVDIEDEPVFIYTVNEDNFNLPLCHLEDGVYEWSKT